MEIKNNRSYYLLDELKDKAVRQMRNNLKNVGFTGDLSKITYRRHEIANYLHTRGYESKKVEKDGKPHTFYYKPEAGIAN